jgi:hypothetical protein
MYISNEQTFVTFMICFIKYYYQAPELSAKATDLLEIDEGQLMQ